MELLKTWRGGESLESIVDRLFLRRVDHPDGRTILNYDQYFSPKFDPIVRECRGLVVDRNTMTVVARAFPRFFNLGEVPAEDAVFDWSTATVSEKVDGSLMLLYHRNGVWQVNTRGSFADGKIDESGRTWDSEFFKVLSRSDLWWYSLNESYTYCFEFCSPWNQVVAYHPEPRLYLLSAFNVVDGAEMQVDARHVAEYLQVRSPKVYGFGSGKEVVDFLKSEDVPATFEGFVVRDGSGRRVKVKNARYVALHSLHSNGNIYLVKTLVPMILAGETAEVEAYFPELTKRIEDVKARLDAAASEMMTVWQKAQSAESQREFAAVALQSPLSGILFTARKTGRDPIDVFRESAGSILRVVFKEKEVVA